MFAFFNCNEGGKHVSKEGIYVFEDALYFLSFSLARSIGLVRRSDFRNVWSTCNLGIDIKKK